MTACSAPSLINSVLCVQDPKEIKGQNLDGWGVRSELETVIKGSPFDSVKRVQRKSMVAREEYGKKKGLSLF